MVMKEHVSQCNYVAQGCVFISWWTTTEVHGTGGISSIRVGVRIGLTENVLVRLGKPKCVCKMQYEKLTIKWQGS